MARDRDRIYDELLVIRCRAGDREAFRELVDRWQRPLVGRAVRLTGRRDVALDAVQDTWIAVIRDLHRLDDPARFPAYVHRILVRRCADAFRRQQAQRRTTDRLRAASTEPAVPVDVESRSEARSVRDALAALPEDGRVVLALHYLEELPLRDIARILGVAPGTVKSRLSRARRALKSILEKRRRQPCPTWKT